MHAHLGKDRVIGMKKCSLLVGSKRTWSCKENMGAEVDFIQLPSVVRTKGEERRDGGFVPSVAEEGGTSSSSAELFPTWVSLRVWPSWQDSS